ncbi:hypothetical protein M0812_05943 [Anaeramoeba flamelloides]|uniref:Uncharacterized protein n=1 Tax=Anaeramoeba flamelloides TaxID=1746091 RepID=A0AAV8AC28_9EUKA|nr:hypothetical protein M0812_05943 [Anaeramoeba flamelloides]
MSNNSKQTKKSPPRTKPPPPKTKPPPPRTKSRQPIQERNPEKIKQKLKNLELTDTQISELLGVINKKMVARIQIYRIFFREWYIEEYDQKNKEKLVQVTIKSKLLKAIVISKNQGSNNVLNALRIHFRGLSMLNSYTIKNREKKEGEKKERRKTHEDLVYIFDTINCGSRKRKQSTENLTKKLILKRSRRIKNPNGTSSIEKEVIAIIKKKTKVLPNKNRKKKEFELKKLEEQKNKVKVNSANNELFFDNKTSSPNFHDDNFRKFPLDKNFSQFEENLNNNLSSVANNNSTGSGIQVNNVKEEKLHSEGLYFSEKCIIDSYPRLNYLREYQTNDLGEGFVTILSQNQEEDFSTRYQEATTLTLTTLSWGKWPDQPYCWC